MVQQREVDVVVVGLGPGGEYVAHKLADAGLEVVGVEMSLVGGECPYVGCTPSKLLVRAAHTLAESRHADDLGGEVDVRPDYRLPARRIAESTNHWTDDSHRDRLVEAGVEVLRGRGRLDGPGRVVVEPAGDDDGGAAVQLTARRGVVLATGTKPSTLPIDGLDQTPYWTNREIFHLDEAPASMAVIGAGAIGCELTQAFARFGTEVVLLEVADRILAPEEPETSAALQRVLEADGVDVRTGVTIDRVDHDDGFRLEVDGETLEVERLLVAAGRTTQLTGLGLASVGLDEDADVVETDERLRAGERLWAVGDITGKGPYTHVALYQAGCVVRDLLGEDEPGADYRAVTRVTFTDPEVGAVGLTEEEAREAGLPVATSLAEIPRSSRGWMHGDGNDGIIKLVADTERGVLVGATAMAPYGGEVLGLLSAAVHAEIPITTLQRMHFAYPTFHRTIEVALRDLA